MARGQEARYSLRGPCADCPFLVEPQFLGLSEDRIRDIADSLRADQDFSCHKRNDFDEHGNAVETRTSRMCGGAMVTLEKEGRATQGMRISERLGMYDRTKLDMGANVHDSLDDWEDTMVDAAQENGW